MRILLVEDERRVASFVSRALRENSYAVDLAETGEKAIEMAMQNAYDSILLDVRLPGLSGIHVCRELRDARIDTPILMLTARGLVEQRVEGLDAGAALGDCMCSAGQTPAHEEGKPDGAAN